MKMKIKKEKLLYVGAVATVINTTMICTNALADSNPGVKLGAWIQTNVAGLFIGLAAVIGLTLLFNRQFMKALITAVFAALAAIFVFGGSAFAQKLGDIVSGWFN